jgi:hypothetical protein
MKNVSLIPVAAVLIIGSLAAKASTMGTAFTYQGRLNDGGVPANGLYDFKFKLYDTATGGTLLSLPDGILLPEVGVTNGLFTVKLDFGGPVFDGAARWLDLSANTNGSTPMPLSPRQELTPQPYALFAATAGSVPDNAITTSMIAPGAVTPQRLSGNTVPATGDVLSYNGSGFAWQHPATAQRPWLLGGNGLTSPGTDFIGTTDNNSLYFKVNNQRALWIRPTSGVPNLIGGSLYNGTAAGVEGAFIGGGGNAGADNSIYSSFGALAGGLLNRIDAVYGFLGGGATNRIFGTAGYGVLAGGQSNTLRGDHGVIGGGWNNNNQTSLGTIGGGANHILQASYSATIAGGYENTVFGQDATVGGGSYNIAQALASVIGGGQDNYVGTNIWQFENLPQINYASYSTIAGGQENRISSIYSSVLGGYGNRLYGDYGTVGGGSDNLIGDPNTFSTSPANGTIGGGAGNQVLADFGTVSGGSDNITSAQGSMIPGGIGAQTRVPGQMAHGFGNFAASGDAQASTYVLRGTSSSTNTYTSLLAGGSKIVVPPDSAMMFDIQLVGGLRDDAKSAYHITGGIARSPGTGTYLMSSSPHTDLEAHGIIPNLSWRVRVVVDSAKNALDVQVAAGEPGVTTRWVATVRTTEVILP